MPRGHHGHHGHHDRGHRGHHGGPHNGRHPHNSGSESDEVSPNHGPSHHRGGHHSPPHRGGHHSPHHRGGHHSPDHRGGHHGPHHRGGHHSPHHRGGHHRPHHRGGHHGPHHRGGHHGPHSRSRSRSPDRGSCRDRSRYTNFVRYRRGDCDDGPQRNPQAPDPKIVLTVKECDLKIEKNTRLHHTNEYDVTQGKGGKLVVRRGQPFDIQLEMSKPYDRKVDDLRIVFELGDNPTPAKETEVEITLSDEDLPKNWGAKILSQEGNTLTVTIFTPPTCFVGKWGLNIDVIKKEGNETKTFSYEHDDKIYIIFNPWCKSDDAYMEEEKCRFEYVLNESGRVFRGSKNNISAKPWNFGQFDDPCLDVALHLLDITRLNHSSRGNLVLVSRKLSAAVNSSDDGGVLTGNWSGKYDPHRNPSSWMGSVAILKKFWTEKTPVKFGQCWVFSGVLTTIGRTLGIPTRSVTNFASAHDTDGSITIDMHYDEAGEPLDNDDSVWNFHVWNECWFARNDLPKGYGGWQAIDSTPQEISGDTYCCGPVSVNALREGEVMMPHDASFVFAEVNADKVFWQRCKDTGAWKNVHLKKNEVGKNISTKAVGSNEREDVTLAYKPAEGSAAERAVVRKANQLASTREHIYEETPEDVTFEIEQDEANTWVGEPFLMTVKVTNTSKEKRTIDGRVVVKTMYYTGVTGHSLLSLPFEDVVLQKGECRSVDFKVTSDEYLDKLKDCCMIDVSVLAKVEETNQTFVGKEDYRLRKPHLKVKCQSEATKGTEFTTEISFTNPLDVSLTNCIVGVDGLARDLDFRQKNVGPKSTFVAEIPITAYKIGQKELLFSFSSTQLDDINASVNVFVRAPAR